MTEKPPIVMLNPGLMEIRLVSASGLLSIYFRGDLVIEILVII
jgi:hypothetical protein